MTFETSPDPGRSVMTAREAARFLRKDPRTIRRMIESGELAGGADPRGERRRWYVYTDQLNSPGRVATSLPDSGDSALRRENARLRDEIGDLRARLISSEEAYRLVLAQQDTMQEALVEYQASVDDLLAGTNSFREAAGHFHHSAAGLQSSNSKLNAIIGAYSDALHQNLIPGHPGLLDVREPGL